MGSLKARSVVWVLVVLVGCSVFARLTRGKPVEPLVAPGNSSSEAGMLGRVPAILSRLIFGKQEQPAVPEVADEEVVKAHPTDCLCGQYFKPTEDGKC